MIQPGQIYQHYKGTKVEIITTALHSETKEPMAVYTHLEDGRVWVRPLAMFEEEVVVNGKRVKRFTLL